MPTLVRVTWDEAELKTSFKPLVDRITAEFEKGQEAVDLDFPVGCHGGGRVLYSAIWASTQDLIIGDKEVHIAPANVLTECLRYLGYPSVWKYGDSVPSIRLTRIKDTKQAVA